MHCSHASLKYYCIYVWLHQFFFSIRSFVVGRDAAALACACRDAAAAAPASKWHSAVRVGRSGAVFEPASGAFDVTVAPGEDVQAAVDRCPLGGCVLLLPGTHDGPLVLPVNKVVHVFGRGLATLRMADGTVVTSYADVATIDGLVIRCEADGYDRAVWIKGGRLLLSACDMTSAAFIGACVAIEGGADPLLVSCKCVLVRSLEPAQYICLYRICLYGEAARRHRPPHRGAPGGKCSRVRRRRRRRRRLLSPHKPMLIFFPRFLSPPSRCLPSFRAF